MKIDRHVEEIWQDQMEGDDQIHRRDACGAPGAMLLAPNKLSHIERIDVVTVNPERMSLHSLSLEAKFFVEPDSSLVVVIDHQLKAMQSFWLRPPFKGLEKGTAYATTHPRLQDAHGDIDRVSLAAADTATARNKPNEFFVLFANEHNPWVGFRPVLEHLGLLFDTRRRLARFEQHEGGLWVDSVEQRHECRGILNLRLTDEHPSSPLRAMII
jgi:hypothetical protein